MSKEPEGASALSAAPTVKVVINRCFGGFGLSPLAVKRIAERKGNECYFFTQDFSNPSSGVSQPYISATLEEAEAAFMFTAFTVPNPNEVTQREQAWGSMTEAERRAYNAAYTEIVVGTDYERDDPDLVAVVEELGDAANGKHANLAIVEIPADVDWEISEYDGSEHVAEKHRTWYE